MWNATGKRFALVALCLVMGLGVASPCATHRAGKEPLMADRSAALVTLPPPRLEGSLSVEEAIYHRRSVRSYRDEPLSLAEVSQLLWAAQGTTDASGLRSAPSAGALYPLEVYCVSVRVEGLPAGAYRYLPEEHRLEEVQVGDVRDALCDAALNQEWVREAPAVLVIAAVYQRTTGKYRARGERYVHMEVGHAAQNVYLQATALDLGTVIVGAFDDAQVQRILGMPSEEAPLAILPVGRR